MNLTSLFVENLPGGPGSSSSPLGDHRAFDHQSDRIVDDILEQLNPGAKSEDGPSEGDLFCGTVDQLNSTLSTVRLP